MSEGYVIAGLLLLALLYGKMCGIRDQMARIADFCDRAERRLNNRQER